jgi:hypothetical protein
VHVDHVIEFKQQLAMRARTNFGGAKPFEDFGQQRGSRLHVELEQKDIRAIHLALFVPAFFGLPDM